VTGPEWDAPRELAQVIHQSVNEFLRQQGLALLMSLKHKSSFSSQPPGVFDEAEVLCQCQRTLYPCCFLYLATEDTKVDIDLPSYKSANNDGLYMRKYATALEQLPFLNYATINLLNHGREAESGHCRDLPSNVVLLQQVLSDWDYLYRAMRDYAYSEKRPSSSVTVSHTASAVGMKGTVKHLLEGVVNIEARNDQGQTALHLAVLQEHLSIVTMLVDSGADIKAECVENET
jgi:hypothetical protein